MAVGVEGRLVGPLLVEDEQARLVLRFVQVVAETARFGAAGGDEFQQGGADGRLVAGQGLNRSRQHDGAGGQALVERGRKKNSQQ